MSTRRPKPVTIDPSTTSWIHSDLESIAKANVEWYLVWGIIDDYVNGEKRESLGHTSTLDACLVVVQRCREAMLRDEYREGSTSRWSNAVEATKREVCANLLRGSFGNPVMTAVHYAEELGITYESRLAEWEARRKNNA